mmetsp:Transcript_9753/g.21005  ORF Transcript_9753/g.21005 Transcript_9753/m.21005 type:complete len:81 (-) Transcript_9753:132-374(-)
MNPWYPDGQGLPFALLAEVGSAREARNMTRLTPYSLSGLHAPPAWSAATVDRRKRILVSIINVDLFGLWSREVQLTRRNT